MDNIDSSKNPESHSMIRMPDYAVWVTVFLSFAPAILLWLGVDFSTVESIEHFPLLLVRQPQASEISGLGQAYTLMDWSAFCLAGFTAIIALFQFRVHQDIAMPLVGIAMFCAGTFDLFRTLAILNITGGVSDPAGFLPFTWVIARTFHALVMIIGVSLVLRTPAKRSKGDIFYSFVVSMIFLVIASVIVELIAKADALPDSYFPGYPLTRPYDLVPLILFAGAGVILFPKFHKRKPSIFSHALIMMTLPAVVAQLHMTFGSQQLFDSHFHIAHFLKMVTFLVPFAGVCFEQMRLQKQLESEIQERKDAEAALAARAEDLTRSNLELGRFAYVASHDLKEPLRMISSYVQLLERRFEHRLDEKGKHYIATAVDGTNRMQRLIDDLLAYSKAGHGVERFKSVEMNKIVQTVLSDLGPAIESCSAVVTHDPLPELIADRSQLGQLLQNLIANAIKFRGEEQPRIQIGVEEQELFWQFSVKDNGIGISADYKEKVFEVFERLHTTESYSGTGVGLSICKKIVERHGGEIWIESEAGQGTTFLFTISRRIEEVSDAQTNE